MLAPMIDLPLVTHVPPSLLPVTHSRKLLAFAALVLIPELQNDRLTCRQEREVSRNRYAAVRATEVLAEGEVSGMSLEVFKRVGPSLGQLDLHLDGVRLKVDEPPPCHVLGQWDHPAVKIDEKIRRSVAAREFPLRNAKVPVNFGRLPRPVVAEAEAVHNLGKERDCLAPAVVISPIHEHAGRPTVRLDIC